MSDPFIELLQASRDELKRSRLTSLPLKIDFARANGLKMVWEVAEGDPNTVDAWMSATRKRFEAAVKALTPEEV